MAKNKIYKGIDISLFQPGADFPAIKAAGIDFVMLKAGQGRIPGEWNAPFTDPYFERYIKAADAAGLYAGSYWYFMANSEAEVREEAAYYIALLRKYKFNHQLWAALDVEDSHLTGDRAALTAIVKLFCDLVRAAGFRPMVYANSWWLESRFESPAGVPIWEANWSASARPSRARMWQYTSTGKVGGINGNVDMNVAYSIIGDADGDGNVDMADVIRMMRATAGWKVGIDEGQADLDKDGKVSVKDVILLMRALS